ncbi:biotin-[acetylCoA carboxylase] holoenzyme synthetase and biotin operon repressor [Legionella santicrucis]|uniref:Bifunctional ligase/repressor BirA n=1 Tax=Legionella santicrucis TaxID=45074 RepID=A0A0W0YJ68_9GAMM|nr:biotin--[acetyl-CoA-carboxylase] ligase [Legionella santicrucis]KTD56598.1 biotin-[acetylCoA carboxylase] holoenzyme synthetase and biotin operon repressor [Legionella santicrucis]
MHFTSSQLTLLQLLGDGSCHSGSELGTVLGITRSAIWKQINQLIESGIPIKRLPNQGYQLLNPLILLDKEQINEYFLLEKLVTPFNLHLFTSIDSTNRYLKELPISNTVDICCAEIQTHGRGRFGRQWHSPFGENIYCSSRWNLNYDLTKLSGLSLVTSLAVLATLNELKLSTNIKIKWPNDILWNDKKLCGSLIEIITESNSTIQVIIGIGLNVNTDTQKHPLPDRPWCSLYEIAQQHFDRNFLIAKLITHLERYLIQFFHNDLSSFIHEWNKSDYLFGKTIQVTQSLNTLTGIACGINQLGQLILQDESGQKHFLSSGDTSLHKQYSP